MSTPVTYVNNQYLVPAYQDTGYAQGAGNLSSYLIALATGSLTLSGGSFPLTADVDFGGSFGVKSLYYKSRATNPSTTGVIRLGSAEVIAWRNNANGANLPLTTDVSDNLLYNGSIFFTSGGNLMISNATAKAFIYCDASKVVSSTTAVADGELLIGSTGNVPVKTTLTGTSNQVVVTNGSGSITLSTPQNIAATSTPTFAALTLTNTTNQIVLGTTRTVTITAPTPASSSRTWTIPDLSTSPTFAALEAAQTFSGAKTFSATLTMSGATIAMGSQKITGLANGTTSTDAAAFGQIKVLQVVTATTTTISTTTSGTFGATNLTASITPTSASNRILIIATGTLGSSAIAVDTAYATILRGGSNILGTNGGTNVISNAAVVNIRVPSTLTYIDSPATTSSTTYAIGIKSDGGGSTITWGTTNTTQSITLMEVV